VKQFIYSSLKSKQPNYEVTRWATHTFQRSPEDCISTWLQKYAHKWVNGTSGGAFNKQINGLPPYV